ncbi:MAG: glycosyltransferase family 4 protein [Bacteroidota bacterium]|nr:glycosyltransferase family 4 protein [Bacteroidota bacterium]
MHILYLCQYFPPEMGAPAARAYEFSRRWVRMGHRVSVICGIPNHPIGRVYPGYTNALLHHERIERIDVYRTWVYVTPNARKFRRSLNYLSFGISAVLAAETIRDVDVCIATTPQFFVGVGGTFVRALRRVPLVLEVRDLWPDAIPAVRIDTDPRFLAFLRRIERYMYSRADRIVIVSPAYREHLLRKGVPDEKIHVITNGVSTHLFDRRPAPRVHFNGRMKDSFLVAYFGTHGLAHGLETLVDTAKQFVDDPAVQFVLVGEGAAKAELIRYADGLPNVHFFERRSRQVIAEMLNEIDVSLVLLRKAELFETVIPSKLFEIMGVGKPIILGVRGESKRILEEARAGIAVEPEDAAMTAAAIRKLREDEDLRRQYGDNAYRFVREQYDLDRLAVRYAEILAELA